MIDATADSSWVVAVPSAHGPEAEWIASTVFGDLLGLAVSTCTEDRSDFLLSAAGRSLSMSSPLLDRLTRGRLDADDLDRLRLGSAAGLDPVPTIHRAGEVPTESDPLGTAFLMLSGYEECVRSDRDRHGRFPAAASLAARAGMLDRPIVDEIVESIRDAIERIWPGAVPPPTRGGVEITCDIDRASDPAAHDPGRLLRRIALSLLGRADEDGVLELLDRWRRVSKGDIEADPFRSGVELLLDAADLTNRPGTFFIIPEVTDPSHDLPEDTGSRAALDLMDLVLRRGHELGVHPGYRCHDSADRMNASIDAFRHLRRRLGVEDRPLVSRMHYLRWTPGTTAGLLDDAGVDADSTLGFAEAPGFRTGTSREHAMFDVTNRRPLRMRQRPLVAMDATLLHDRYLGLGPGTEARERLATLAERATRHGGPFRILWHNSELNGHRSRGCLKSVVEPGW